MEARFSAPVQTGPGAPPSLLYNGYRVFPGVKEQPGRDADPSPPSSSVGHKRVELYLYSPYGPTACTELQCLYKGDLYLTRPEQDIKTVMLEVCMKQIPPHLFFFWNFESYTGDHHCSFRYFLRFLHENNETVSQIGHDNFLQSALQQCFSTFVRPRPGKLFFQKTRARSQQIYS